MAYVRAPVAAGADPASAIARLCRTSRSMLMSEQMLPFADSSTIESSRSASLVEFGNLQLCWGSTARRICSVLQARKQPPHLATRVPASAEVVISRSVSVSLRLRSPEIGCGVKIRDASGASS